MEQGDEHAGHGGDQPADQGDHGHQGHPQADEEGEGHPEDEHGDQDDHPEHDREGDGAEHVAGHLVGDPVGDVLHDPAPVGPHRPEQAGPEPRGLQQHEQGEEGDGEQGEDGREDGAGQVGALAQGRLAQVLGRRLQLGGVLLHPGQQMEALEGVGQPAVALLDLADHGRQALGHVGQRVDQRVAEQAQQPGEEQGGRGEDQPDGRTPAEAVALEEVDRRVEHQGDEGGDQDPEDDLAQPADEAVEDPGGDDHGVDGQDGAEGDALGRGRREQPLAPGRLRARPRGRGSRRASR